MLGQSTTAKSLRKEGQEQELPMENYLTGTINYFKRKKNLNKNIKIFFNRLQQLGPKFLDFS